MDKTTLLELGKEHYDRQYQNYIKEMEFKLLSYLIENKNRVLSKDELFDKVWQDLFLGDGTLSVHIRRLREKVEQNPNDPQYLKTVWGVGYVFEVKHV